MSTEVWFRNPAGYIKELVECGEYKIAWDRGYLVKKKTDPIKHASLYYGETYPWRVLAVGPQGSAEYRTGDEIDRPSAVYPTWAYGEDSDILLEMITNPVGQDPHACNDKSVAGDERPVLGQEHRIVIIDTPAANLSAGRAFFRWLKEVQEDYPECIIHVHGLYGFRPAFGMGWGAADVEPRAAAQKGKVNLASGKEIKYEEAQRNPHWVTSLGFLPVDLAIPRVRCMYNIKSAVWAGENYAELFKFRTRNDHRPDTLTPKALYSPPVTASPFIGAVEPKPGDKFACDTCSLADKCKYYRAGAVCAVPDAHDAKELAAQFKTRDSEEIIDALGTLAAAGTRRLEYGMRTEEMLNELDPHVTKMLNQTFAQGVTLAKLVDPNLRGGAKVQVNVGPGGQAAVVAGTSTKTMIAGVIRELENQGYKREDITEDMVKGYLESMARKQTAIEGTVVDE